MKVKLTLISILNIFQTFNFGLNLSFDIFGAFFHLLQNTCATRANGMVIFNSEPLLRTENGKPKNDKNTQTHETNGKYVRNKLWNGFDGWQIEEEEENAMKWNAVDVNLLQNTNQNEFEIKILPKNYRSHAQLNVQTTINRTNKLCDNFYENIFHSLLWPDSKPIRINQLQSLQLKVQSNHR